ncbi:lipid-A-disaccharide synthase N-terminal domain-containing protein [Hyphomicrobium sp.]|uniref:lipid-A-disaccharide synthase N-terminal domain-containing protein n=1 Tax=Hyphomicrobium sp. TaxID=82 RepID=UPI003FA5D0EC
MTAAAPVASDTLWLGIGLAGQMLFTMRFLIQWIASEKQRRSVIPRAFWYFSLAGGFTLLAYAIRRADPVFIIGQASGILIYGRNLYFVAGRSRPAETTGTACDSER